MSENKIYTSLDELIKDNIMEGMYIHIASTMSRPNALINTLIKMYEGKNPQFIFSMTAIHGNLHAIAISGIAKKVITGFLGDNYPKPRTNCLYSDILKNDPFELEMVTLLTFILRLMGAALNLPYVVTNSLKDSDLETINSTNILFIEDKQGEKVTLLRSLYPDITLVHGVCADSNGNILLSSPMGEGEWGCLAARKGVIATVEKIVDSRTFSKYLDKAIIPGNRVLGICEVPYGAYPQAMNTYDLEGIQSYYDDYQYFMEAREAVINNLTAKKWYAEHIKIVDAKSYWRQIPVERWEKIHRLKFDNYLENINSDLSLNEILIILAARSIIRKVKTGKYKTILAGIGMAHISAWVAKRILEKEGIDIHIMAELGFYGMDPVDGDVFLFSQRHSKTCEQQCDVLHTLGTQVGFMKTCLGIIGAAEVDIYGNVNSTRLSDGTYMTGSGGANDIASVTDCIVVSVPGRRKLVEKVDFITSPGKNIKTLITTFGEFEKVNGEFQLQSWYNAKQKYVSPQNAVDEYTEWKNCKISKTLKNEEEIQYEERKIVWTIDKEGFYRT